MKKNFILPTLAALFTAFLLFPQQVHAAGFIQDAAGVKYQNDDGTYAADTWVQVGPNLYRLDAAGIVQTGWIQVGNLWYFLDASGICTNPAGSETPPAQAAVPDTGNIYKDAGWLPFRTDDANILNNGIAAGLVGFDGAQYWAAPGYPDMINAAGTPAVPPSAAVTVPADASVSAPANAPAAVPVLVWVSATGKKYHIRNDCGTMNPDKARQITQQEAQSKGMQACKICF